MCFICRSEEDGFDERHDEEEGDGGRNAGKREAVGGRELARGGGWRPEQTSRSSSP